MIQESYNDTELVDLFDWIKSTNVQKEDPTETVYKYSKTLKMDKDFEIELYINPSRKKKTWSNYMDKVGTNVKLIKERFDDETLHANQVLLTGDYDEATSDEEITGFDEEAKREAEVAEKKDFITNLLGKGIAHKMVEKAADEASD